MSRILRYELDITDHQELPLDSNSVPVSVAVSRTDPNGKIDLWVLVNDGSGTPTPFNGSKRNRSVLIAGTGHPIPPGVNVTHKFIGTVVTPSDLVWHVFVAR